MLPHVKRSDWNTSWKR